MKRIILTLLSALCFYAGFAQFTLDGQYRARGELRNGFKRPIVGGQLPAAFIEHRARLSAGYKKEKIGFKFSVQDVRIWGETGQINKSDQLLSVHEAYADYYAGEKSTVRIGRQEMIYDDQRLIGNLDWTMQARSFDAVRYMFKSEKSQFDIMASWNQEGYSDGNPEPTKLTGTNYSIVTGGGTNTRIFNLNQPKSEILVVYKRNLGKSNIGITFLNDYFNSNDSTDELHSDYTLGVSPNFILGKLETGGQFYYTGGTAGKTYDADGYHKIALSGYLLSAFVKYTGINGSPLLGIDYISGDDATTSDKVEGWSPKYGTNHKFYGNMDYFYVGNGHGGTDAQSAGLMDIYLKTTFIIGEKLKISGDAHSFSSTAGRTYAATGEKYKGILGYELDLSANFAITPEISVMGGYSQMFGMTNTMKMLKFGNPETSVSSMQNWTWIMIAFSPKLIIPAEVEE